MIRIFLVDFKEIVVCRFGGRAQRCAPRISFPLDFARWFCLFRRWLRLAVAASVRQQDRQARSTTDRELAAGHETSLPMRREASRPITSPERVRRGPGEGWRFVAAPTRTPAGAPAPIAKNLFRAPAPIFFRAECVGHIVPFYFVCAGTELFCSQWNEMNPLRRGFVRFG